MHNVVVCSQIRNIENQTDFSLCRISLFDCFIYQAGYHSKKTKQNSGKSEEKISD